MVGRVSDRVAMCGLREMGKEDGVLSEVVQALACPHCGAGLLPAGTVSAGQVDSGQSLRCASGHVFDIARQGYVSLLSGRERGVAGDTAAMVAARVSFLAAGHYDPIAEHVAAAAERSAGGVPGGVVLDAGAGTGYYVARVMDRLPERVGVAVDVSKYAARRAAKAHQRVGAVVADVWRRIPLRAATASIVLNVFAPRNAEEMRRVLQPGGCLVVVTPTARHLAELVDALGLLNVDERKQQRLGEQLGGTFKMLEHGECEFSMALRRDEVETLVAMGPSAWHTEDAAMRARLAELPEPVDVTGSVTVSVYQRLEDGSST